MFYLENGFNLYNTASRHLRAQNYFIHTIAEFRLSYLHVQF